MAKPSSIVKGGSGRSSTTPRRKPARKGKAKAAAPAAPPEPEPAPVVDTAMIDPPASAVVESPKEPEGQTEPQETPPEAADAVDGPGEVLGGDQAEKPAAPLEPVAPEPVAGETAADTDASVVEGEELFDELFGEGQGDEILDQDEAAAPVAGADGPQDLNAVVAAPPAPSDAPEQVRLGVAFGTLYRVPRGVVEALLGQETLDRIAAIRGAPSSAFLELQKRMRASDGRCAPAIFTAAGEDAPVIFSGVEAIAAGMELGLSHLSVVTVAPDDAGAVQSYLVHKDGTGAAADDEDDLIRRVHAHHEE